jgi:hypothetical protein
MFYSEFAGVDWEVIVMDNLILLHWKWRKLLVVFLRLNKKLPMNGLFKNKSSN